MCRDYDLTTAGIRNVPAWKSNHNRDHNSNSAGRRNVPAWKSNHTDCMEDNHPRFAVSQTVTILQHTTRADSQAYLTADPPLHGCSFFLTFEKPIYSTHGSPRSLCIYDERFAVRLTSCKLSNLFSPKKMIFEKNFFSINK